VGVAMRGEVSEPNNLEVRYHKRVSGMLGG